MILTLKGGGRAFRSALLVAVWVGLSGCARRFDLTPGELERIQGLDPEYQELRVYPKRLLISDYPEVTESITRDVTRRKVVERGAKKPLERKIHRRDAGKVLAVDSLNGMPRLWVTFYSGCTETACAYAFVETEHGYYSLVSVPELERYKEPRSFRRNRLKRNRLKLMRLRSMIEVNEVLAARRRSGKGKSIELQIRKDRWRPTRKQRDWADGVR